MESGQAPQLTGVVIISLPPPDNPSLGKTITAFTLYDSSQTPPQQLQQAHHDHHQQQLPIQSAPNPELQLSSRKLLFGIPRFVLGLLGISVVALMFWVSESPTTLFELRSSDEDDDRKPSSFVFPLYPKLGLRDQRDVELKLGRFVEIDSENVLKPFGDGVRHKKIPKLVSMASNIDSTAIIPVRGNIFPDGLYYTHMMLGNPPRPYFLDMDTGSDLTWVQCDAPCSSCAKGANPLYKPPKAQIIPSKDSLCIEVQRNQKSGYCETCSQCDYEVEYADHSSSMGVLARDELHLTVANGSLIKKNVVFGCAYDQQGFLLSSLIHTDGILGLSRAKVSLPSQLASQGIINNVVGHCLTTDIVGGGYMFLGDDFVPYSQLTWISMLNRPSTNFYQSEVFKMSYGNKQLRLGGLGNRLGRVVFDSGSSYTYLTRDAYSDLLASLKDISGEGLVQDASDPTLPICWRAKFPIRSVVDVKQFFKPLTLQFGSKWWITSTKLRIPPEGYLIINNKGNVCLGILDGSKVHDGSTIILGDISLRGQLIVYDNVNQRIGWTKSDCENPQRSKSLPSLFEN